MYLDTDIILALVKPTDWLKPHINVRKIVNPKTSVIAILEAELILLREHGREQVYDLLSKVKKKNIKILSLDEKIIEKSNELLKKYNNLNIFDSVHAAFSVVKKETLVSTDKLFDKIDEINKIDPRNL